MKRALVTGSSSGLGAALARQLTARGYAVTGIDRKKPETEVLAAFIPCDFSSRTELDASLAAILSRGPYDAVFLNAGVSATGKFEDIPVSAHLALLRINLEAPIILTNALLQDSAFKGHICFISSLSYFTGYPGAASYAASKDGLAIYAKSLRKAGTTTTIAFPGPLDTPHATRHAPQSSTAKNRMKPDIAAQAIIEATLKGKRKVLPGLVAKISSILGLSFPGLTTGIMHKKLYDKLDKSVF